MHAGLYAHASLPRVNYAHASLPRVASSTHAGLDALHCGSSLSGFRKPHLLLVRISGAGQRAYINQLIILFFLFSFCSFDSIHWPVPVHERFAMLSSTTEKLYERKTIFLRLKNTTNKPSERAGDQRDHPKQEKKMPMPPRRTNTRE
jgi:hypothetical protein